MLERTKSDQHCQPISRMQRLTMAKSAVDRRGLRRCPHFPGWLTPCLATKFVFIVCALVLMGRAPAGAEPLELFVSPTGNDSWSGTTADPQGDGRDGPFASLQRARDEIRSRRAEGPAEGLSDSVTVFVLGASTRSRKPWCWDRRIRGPRRRRLSGGLTAMKIHGWSGRAGSGASSSAGRERFCG